MDVFEVMETSRAMRRLKPDPVPDELLRQLVYHATRAPSAGNSQLWGFLVVTDPADKAFFAALVQSTAGGGETPEEDDSRARMMRSVRHLVSNFERVPAIIFSCIEDVFPAGSSNPQYMWSSIFPATQNLLLAARALGLGAAMTTFQLGHEEAIKERFGIPTNVHIAATIPVGYPEGRFGPVSRLAVEEVIHWGRWGARKSEG